MLQICVRLSGLVLVASFLFNAATAEEPIFTVQTSGTTRLLQVIQALGVPDPIASAGLDSAATLERMRTAISLTAPAGGLIFFAAERPHLVVCLPLTGTLDFKHALDAFATTAPVLDASGVYVIGTSNKFYAKQASGFILISDSDKYINDAVHSLTTHPWTNVTDDIQVKCDFQPLFSTSKTVLLQEFLSLTTTPPTAGLYLNPESLREHLRFGLQQYLVRSLFSCRTFDMTANLQASGDLQVRLQTREDTAALRIPSAFKHSQSAGTAFAIDFTSSLTEANTQATLKWLSAWESDILSVLNSDLIQDKSDVTATSGIVKFLSELVKQAIANRRLDGFATIGSNDSQAYLAAAVSLTDSGKLATQLNAALEAAKQIGLSYTDLRSSGQAADSSQADVLIDVPNSLALVGNSDEKARKLHVRIAAQTLWIGMGNESERLRDQVIKTSDNGSTPVTVHCDMDAGTESFGEIANVLPFNFRQLKMTIQMNSEGRVYELVMGQSKAKSLATPANTAQASTN